MLVEEEKIVFIITGGTIDSYLDTITDKIIPNNTSRIKEYMNSLNTYQNSEYIEYCMKDSRELTVDDLANITKIIEENGAKYFLITHGTFTIPDTARYIARRCKRDDITVILTGAWKPIYGFDGSDAAFNIGYALGKINALDAGVYVAMHGRIFEHDEVSKTLAEGRFTSIDD